VRSSAQVIPSAPISTLYYWSLNLRGEQDMDKAPQEQ
jgi:hypothetical protein